ncbi:tetratricopeptide repeat protein, partial [Streptomyces sp. NPDC001927]
MDPQRLVWVGTCNPKGCGSGYLIGPQLVLTALHVVRAEGRWAEHVETRIGHADFGGFEHRRAQVCWPDPLDGVPSPDALDIALLWLDKSVSTSEGPVLWGHPSGTVQIPYAGAGFPAFAADAGSPAHVEALRGELSAVSTSSAGWVLDCQVWPAPGRDGERPWAGASGSAIFCHGRLVGVAVEDNRPMEWRRLHAAPIHRALGLTSFARLITRHGHPGTSATLEEVTAGTDTSAPGRSEVRWPIVVGQVPTQATALQPRSALREKIDKARSAGGAVVLTQVLSGGGGVGKTQLAAACATDALEQSADLVVWTPATELQQVITQYAQASADLHLPGVTGEDPEADARVLLRWLAATSRRWLIVLDDITDVTTLGTWWPVSRTGSGWVLATTRLHDARLTGGGRTRIDVGVYNPEESLSYIQERLNGDDMGHLLDEKAPALAEALGHLPLALGLAAAHMLNEARNCTEYLEMFSNRATRLDDALPDTADTEGYGRQITVALLLSLDAAQAADTTSLAIPALRLTALLDPAGNPHALWATPPVLNYLTSNRPDGEQVSANQTHSVLRLLHRYALITHDTRTEPRSVRIHALTARAIRETIPEPELPNLATTAADALLYTWPEIDQPHRDLATALRTNADALAQHSHHQLWRAHVHPVLYRAGRSLLDAGLTSSATAHWQQMVDTAEHQLGPDHPDTLAARHNLASSYQQAGRTREAIDIKERVVADCERLLGPDHPDTLTARANLATSYQQAGRTREAIDIKERVVAYRERLLGPDDPNTLTARANLASSYWQAGRTREAIDIEERVVADCERLLGPDHPDTVAARANLASSYQQAGRTREAIDIEERVVADRERLLGPDHPNTLATRHNLASSYEQAGRTREAIDIKERVVADSERLLGPDHPNTLTARANLATSYQQAGRTREAIDIKERVVADSERLLGPDHPNTLAARHNLASSYQQADRTREATGMLERVVTDCERLLGPDHPNTLTARANLATSYQQAGRTQEAIDIKQRVVADSERLLGPDHPNTLTARANLATSYQEAGRTQEAVDLLERVVADSERLLGPDHPNTLTARANLATSYQEADRTQEAVDLLERVVADSERLLGPDHPNTLTARA